MDAEDNLLQKSANELTDEEVLELFDYEIELRGYVPFKKDLEDEESEWRITADMLSRAAGGLKNSLWLVGREPEMRSLQLHDSYVGFEQTYDERTELLQHELRSLEHELGRPPKDTEAKGNVSSYNKKLRRRAGIPYRPLAHKGHGLVQPEREDEVVEMLFEERIDPSILVLNGSVHGKEISSGKKARESEIYEVMENYSIWVAEENSGENEGFSIETEEDLKEAVFQLIAEKGLNQQEVIRELDVPRHKVDPVTSAMAEKGFVEVDGELGYTITHKGREAYSGGNMAEKIDVDLNLSGSSKERDSVDEFDGRFSSEKTFNVFRLLGEGMRLGEIADEIDENYSSVRYEADKLKEQGLVDTRSVFTDDGFKDVLALTEIGEEHYEEIDQIEVSSQDIELGDFSGDFQFKYSEEIFRMLGEGYRSQTEIAKNLETSQSALLNSIKELKSYGFVETRKGQGTWLTEEGEDFYENHYESQETVEDSENCIDSLSEVPDMLTDEQSLEIMSFLEEGNTVRNIAVLTDRSRASIKEYVKKYDREGLIERNDGDIVMNEAGMQLYQMVEQELSR